MRITETDKHVNHANVDTKEVYNIPNAA